jgi:hypothetical protein
MLGFRLLPRFGALLWGFLHCIASVQAQRSVPEPLGKSLTADALVERLVQRSSLIQDLSAEVHVLADVPRVKIKPLSGTMHYLAPDRFHLKSTRLALLPRQNPMELFEFLRQPQKYRSMLMGNEAVGRQSAVLLSLLPTGMDQDWQLIRLWVQPQSARILQAEITRRSLGTVQMQYFYKKALSPSPGSVPDLPDSLLFEMDASSLKLPKALTADLHRGSVRDGLSPAQRPLRAPDGKARVAMGFRWISQNQGAAARFFKTQKAG